MSSETPSAAALEPTTIEKMRGLRWAIASNSANTIFVQFTFFGSVFVLFLNRMGFSKTDIGFLLSFMPFAGLIALFIAPMVARFGYKRTFLIFYTLRKVATAFLLLIPLVLQMYGQQLTFIYIGVITAAFALFRAIAETGRFPWTQEYVPSTVQGKFTATNNVFATIAGFVAVTIAGFVVERAAGLTGFMWLIGVGVVVGLLSIWLMSRVPGGAPVVAVEDDEKPHRDLSTALTDRNFLRYLAGAGLVVLAAGPLKSFVPLYMEEQVGLTTGNVVFLQSATLLASMLTSFLWGWAADRYGSKPIMLSGVFLSILMPVAWLLMPHHSPLSLPIALAIAFFLGVSEMGWAIGSARLLFVGVVPPDKKTDYMALFFAFVGVAGGLSQLFGGRLLDLSQGISGSIFGFELNPFVPLFVLGIVAPIGALLLLRRIQSDETLSMRQFVGIFYRGNPFLAMSSLLRYQFARDEDTTVQVTESLGRTNSKLAVEELLDALEDPRFNVRLEAILAMARLQPDARITAALVKTLGGNTLALSVLAAWALGRIDDQRAIAPLREGLKSTYRTIRAQCARTLGTLLDEESIPTLLKHFQNRDEADVGLHMAYASALGKLRVDEAVDEMLVFLQETTDQNIRFELALALARVVGDEGYFVQLERSTRADSGTALSQAMTGLGKAASKAAVSQYVARFDECADVMAHDDMTRGLTILREIATAIVPVDAKRPVAKILRACAAQIEEVGTDRLEYTILAIHALNIRLGE